MKYFILILFLLCCLLKAENTDKENASESEARKEQIKQLNFSKLNEECESLLENSEDVQNALESLEEKFQGDSDNPFESGEGASQAIELVERLCEQTTNETQMAQVMKQLENNLEKNIKNNNSDSYCNAAQNYLNISDNLLVKNEEKLNSTNNTLQGNVQKAMNMVIKCSQFQGGELNLSLQNSNISMKCVNPNNDTDVNITAGGHRVRINQKMMERLKELAGAEEDEEVIITVKSANKNQSGLNQQAQENITVSKVVTAEFKKRNAQGNVSDISVGQLSDDTTVEVEFSEEVDTEENVCARYENEEWVESGEFQGKGKSNVCLMNHASEYSIVSKLSVETEFAARFAIQALFLVFGLLFF